MTEQDEQAAPGDTLIAGKFKSQDELVKAYKALESKLGGRPQQAAAPLGGAPQEFEAEASGAVGKKIAEINTALSALQAGDMSAAAKLTALGADPRLVQSALGVMQDTQRRYQARLQEAAGGKDNYDALNRWINEDPKVESFERDAYSEALNSGNIQRSTEAIRHMANLHRDSTGYAPAQLSISVPGGGTKRVDAYANVNEVGAATGDPRYWKDSRNYDPVYAAEVQARMAISPCLDKGFTPDIQSRQG